MDIRNIVETIFRVDDKATSKINAIGSASKSLESQFKKVGAALTAAFSIKVLTDFAKGSVDAALKQDRLTRSIAATDVALQRVGRNISWQDAVGSAKREVETLKVLADSYGLTHDQVLSLRQSLAEPLSAFSNTQINNLIPRLAAAGNLMGFSVDKIAAELDAALDSRLKAKSADFTKSLGINVAAVNKMTPMQVLTEFSKSLDRLQPAMEEFARTNPEAALNRARNDFEKVKEEIGLTLLPPLADILREMKDPLEAFANAVASPGFKEYVAKIGQGAAGGVSFLSQHQTESGVAGAALAGAALIPDARAKVVMGGVAATAVGIGKMTDAMMGGEGPRYIDIPASGERPLRPEDAETSQEVRNLRLLWISGASYMKTGVPTEPLKDFSDAVAQAEQATQSSFANFSAALDGITSSLVQQGGEFFDSAPPPSLIPTYPESLWREVGEQAAAIQKSQKEVQKISQKPIKVEVSLKADMPYQASLSLAGLGNTWNRKVSSRVGGRKIIGHVGE